MIPIKIQFNTPKQVYVLGFQFNAKEGWLAFLEDCDQRYQALKKASEVTCEKCHIELMINELKRCATIMETLEDEDEKAKTKGFLENIMMTMIGLNITRVGQPKMGDIILDLEKLRDIDHDKSSCLDYDHYSPNVGKIDNNGATCPTCDSIVDGFSNRNEHRPEPDDVSICGYCGSVLQFNEDLSVRLADPDALDDVDPKELEFAQDLYKRFQAKKQH